MWDTVWRVCTETFGGVPVVVVINMVQLTYLGWVIRTRVIAAIDDARVSDPATKRARDLARAEAFRRDVRPGVTAMMMLGPGVGLAWSTGLGAVGMGGIGEAMSLQTQSQLMEALGHAYSDISHAYLLMVLGSPPLLLGPLIMLVAGPIERRGAQAIGGPVEEQVLHELRLIRASLLKEDG